MKIKKKSNKKSQLHGIKTDSKAENFCKQWAKGLANLRGDRHKKLNSKQVLYIRKGSIGQTRFVKTVMDMRICIMVNGVDAPIKQVL